MRLSRLFAVPAAIGALVLALTVGAGPAQAVALQKCAGDNGVSHNACLTVESTGTVNRWQITAGLDAFMSQRYAQEIIDHGGNFRATLWSEDDTYTYISNVPLEPGWPSAGPEGLGVQFTAGFHANSINEDNGGDGDELHADITYFDFHVGRNITHRTGTVRGEFVPRRETSCVVVCP